MQEIKLEFVLNQVETQLVVCILAASPRLLSLRFAKLSRTFSESIASNLLTHASLHSLHNSESEESTYLTLKKSFFLSVLIK